MIIDVNNFYNEVDLAEIRIHELRDVVDKFIFLSGKTTFQGKPNLWTLPDHLFYLADIEFWSYDIPSHLRTWDAEYFLKNKLGEHVKRFDRSDQIIMSDGDEIPRADIVKDYYGELNLSMDQYYYNFNNYMRQQDGSFMFRAGNYHPDGVYPMRNHHIYPLIPEAGWEFSFFGDANFIQDKLESYSHDELVTPEYHDLDKIQHRIDNGIDIVDREVYGEPTIPLPVYVTDNPERFKRFL